MSQHAAAKVAADVAATLGTIFAGMTAVLQAVTPIVTGLSAIMACAWWILRWRQWLKTKNMGEG